MELLLDVALYLLIWFMATFIYYVALMELHHFFGKTWWVKALTLPFLVIFDAPLNIILFTIICLELPREWLITERLQRYEKSYRGKKPSELTTVQWWRAQLRWYICDRHLDKYDSITGNHC